MASIFYFFFLSLRMQVVSLVNLPMCASNRFVGIHGATKEKGTFVCHEKEKPWKAKNKFSFLYGGKIHIWCGKMNWLLHDSAENPIR